MRVAMGMARTETMDSIFEHLQAHREWNTVLAIKNQSIVPRQDGDRVRLLQDQGIRNVAEAKNADELDELGMFIDNNVAAGMLTSAAKQINAEFQARLQALMSRFGDYKAGPIKSLERCQWQLQNEYDDAKYPKAARLLDVVR